MITYENARAEIEAGLSAVCAWCEHWHNQRVTNGEMACGMACGGPSVGKGFPLYKGPMIGNLNRICFICGESPDASVEIDGRHIGVCNRMGPHKEACVDKLRTILSGLKNVVVRERVVPIVG